MAKKALQQDLRREIRKTRSRFFSIMMLVVIAVCFLFGLRMAAPDMEASMDAYLDDQQLMDVHILSTLGLTEEDVAAIGQLDGTEQVEGCYTVDALAMGASGQETLTVKAISISQQGINAPALQTGRLPQKTDECLVEASLLSSMGLSLGDTISLNTGSGTYQDALRQTTFTVVGTAKSPLYVSMSRGTSTLGNGSVAAIVMLPSDAFQMDYYTDLYILVEGASPLNAYEDEYESLIDSYMDRVETIQSQREEARTQSVKAEAQQEIDDAWTEYNDAKSDADQELADAWQELEDAKQKLTDGWQDYADGQAELEDGRKELDDAAAQLADAKQTLEDGEAEYQTGSDQYREGVLAYQTGLQSYQEGYDQYQAALAAYQDGLQQYQEALQTYQTGKDAYDDGFAQYQAGEKAYAEGLAQYEEGKAAYESSLAQYQAGEAAYADGLAQYQAAKENYENGLAQYQAGEAAYADGLAQYQAAKEDYESGLAQYQAGEAAYDQYLAQYQAGLAQWQAGADALAQTRQSLLDAGYDASVVDAQLAEQQTQLDESKAALDETAAELQAMRSQLDATQTTLEAGAKKLEESEAALTASRNQLDESKAQLDAGAAQLSESETVLTASRNQLDEGKAQLDAGAAQLAESEAVLAASRNQLDESKAQLEASASQLAEGKAQLDANKSVLAAGKTQLAESKQALEAAYTTLKESEAQLQSAKAELDSAREELDQGWVDYRQGQRDYADGQKELADGEAELSDAYQELVDGQKDYESGLAEYQDAEADAQQELADARQEIEDGQKEVDELESAQWYILDRTANAGFASYQQDAQRMSRLAALFPTVFFLVAALVCLTTMTRMVEEERTQIGSLKALGYSKLDISRKYVGYGLAASLIGGVIGLALGAVGIPYVIVTCWKIMYDYPGVVLTFSWPTALGCLLAAVACCTVAVLVAALAALRATPATLMRPRAPQPGKRVWLEYLTFVWKRLSFNQKVTARNLFRYKKRFWMTVIGIAGCTGLMITGFGLRDSIMDVIDLQYGQLTQYSAVLYTDGVLDEGERASLAADLDSEADLEDYTFCYLTSVTLESPTYSISGNLLAVEQPEDLTGFLTFRDRHTGKPVELEQEGALISEKTADLLGLSVGDSITVVSGDDRGSVPVTGIVENYVQHYVYLTKAAYRQAFGKDPGDKQVLLRYPEDADWEKMGSRLLNLDTVSGVYYLKESKELIRKQLNGVYPAVIIIISAAAALAFVVLYNLSSINITERLRELATMRVLGFRDREMRDYVFRENLVLTLIGMALGVVMGKFFHQYLITTVEVELVMFGRSAHPASYGFAILLTILFALLVNLIAGRRLAKIDMVESLKTVE